MLFTCRVRAGNGSPHTPPEGEDRGDAEGFAQGTCLRVGVSFQEAAAADGPHLHLRPAVGVSGEAWAL